MRTTTSNIHRNRSGSGSRTGNRVAGAAPRIPTGACPPAAGVREGLRVGEYGARGAVPLPVMVGGGTAW
ncbi:hypothetical protein AB0C93_37750 [Streptomyces sp. NPDC048518]|uniref:hypothetical protein n=1 Tax=Streptomyces sp. NPDC048518 TaxID=3155029 RepID=UPI0033DD2A07